MKTTLKRALGRSAEPGLGVGAADGGGQVALFRTPSPQARTPLRRAGRALAGLALSVVALAVGLAGGAFLWFDRSVAALQANSPALVRAAKQLAIPVPGRPAVALLLGIDTRAGSQGGSKNTDTMMLVRADPATHAISLLSFPRDLNVPIYCSGQSVANDRINAAYARCGPKGVLETVQHLTRVPVNYLITVDFHGFKQIVDRLGGIWIDIDRSYFNKNVGTAATNYSNIDLQPGYQRLSGGEALAFVRYRHTDSDLYRLAREQEFVRAVKEQVAQNFDPLRLPSLVSAVTSSVQVAAKTHLSDTTVLEYALFGATLPPGHVVQASIPPSQLSSLDVGGAAELSASPSAVAAAVAAFEHPKVIVARVRRHPTRRASVPARRAVAAPPARTTTLTVLNGNGVSGAATAAAGLLGGRGYRVLSPPHGAPANAPTMNYAQTIIYFDPAERLSATAAGALARLIGPARVQSLPADPRLRALDPKAMLVVVLGRTFRGALSPTQAGVRQEAAVRAPAPQLAAQVQADSGAARSLLTPLVRRTPFPLETPTVLAANSQPDTYGSDQPVRLYPITPSDKAVRMVFVSGGNQFWGIEETSWSGAPLLGDANLHRVVRGRTFDLYYASGHLHMVVLKGTKASYWVVNTLLNTLSNPTMLAIAEGLRPLSRGPLG